MFLTRIASDAVVHEPRLGHPDRNGTWAGIRFPNDLWFRTAEALRTTRPADWHRRLETSLLLFRWEASNTVAAAALIADDDTLLALPDLPENVRAAARRFSDVVSPEDALQTGETWALIYRLAQITTLARATYETYGDTGRIPAELSHRTSPGNTWQDRQRFLDALYASHEIPRDRWSPLSVAYAACRDAVTRWADVLTPEDTAPCWRVTVCPEDRADFLSRAVRPAGLQYAEDDEALFVRCPRLPRVVAVRLMDGIAAAFPHLTFTPVPSDPARRFFGGPASEREYVDHLARLEPLFYTENVNPVPAVLASDNRPADDGVRLTADTPDDLRRFRQTTAPVLNLTTTDLASGDDTACRVHFDALPRTAARPVWRYITLRYPTLHIEPIPPAAPTSDVTATVAALHEPRLPTWEPELIERFKALDDPRRRARFLNPAREAGDEDLADVFASDAPYLLITFDETVESRPDGRFFYSTDAVPGRNELRQQLRRLVPDSRFFPDVTLSATALAAGVPLRHGDTGGFCVVTSPEQLAALKPLLTDDAGDSLDERWTVAFYEGTSGINPPHASSVEA